MTNENEIFSAWKTKLGAFATATTLALAVGAAPAPAHATDPGLVSWGTMVVIDGMETLVFIGLPAGVSPTSAAAEHGGRVRSACTGQLLTRTTSRVW